MKAFVCALLQFAAVAANADCGSGAPWYMPKAVPPPGESTVRLQTSAPSVVTMRVCFCTGDDNTRIVARAETDHTGGTQSTEIFKDACADLSGKNIWLGNPNDRVVKGTYERLAAPAPPASSARRPAKRTP